MNDHYDQREALYESGNWPGYGPAVGPILGQRSNTPAGPKWRDGEPVNLEAAAEDADRWLAYLQGLPMSADNIKSLADCRAALRKQLDAR